MAAGTTSTFTWVFTKEQLDMWTARGNGTTGSSNPVNFDFGSGGLGNDSGIYSIESDPIALFNSLTNGTVTVTGISLSGDGVKTASVPEPTMLALMAIGLAGLALKRRA